MVWQLNGVSGESLFIINTNQTDTSAFSNNLTYLVGADMMYDQTDDFTDQIIICCDDWNKKEKIN